MSGLSKYPGQLDDSISLPPTIDLQTPVKAEVANRLRDAILSLEAELGINPSDTFGTVKDRLDNLTVIANTIRQQLGSDPAGPFNTVEEAINSINSLVNSISTELGNDPSGVFNTVRARLDDLQVQIDAIGGGSGSGSALTQDDKNLTPSVTLGNESATGITITNTPSGDSYVSVFINGIMYHVGNGVKTLDCYFSADSGVTAKTISNIISGDQLIWNGDVTGFDLSTNDRVDFLY